MFIYPSSASPPLRGKLLSRRVLLMGLAALLGCGPAVQTTPEAQPLDLVARDPQEEAPGEDCWPGFRGWNVQGVAPQANPPIQFGPAIACRWKVPLPGRGNSSPAVWKDRIFLTSALEEENPVRLVVWCFHRADGRLLWQHEAGLARGSTHPKNGYASASVATDGQHVVAFFGSVGLVCYDMDGRPIWHNTELAPLEHPWGVASSPVIHGDVIIQLCDAGQNSSLVAVRKKDGRILWRSQRDSYGSWSTPVLLEAVGPDGKPRTEILINGAGHASAEGRILAAYNLLDGQELWRLPGLTEWVAPSVVLGGGLIYSMCGRNGPIQALRPGGQGNVDQSHLVWRRTHGGPYIPTGIFYRNRLYVVTEPGFFTCYNAGSGEEIWRMRLRDTFTASLVAAAGRIYATAESGRVYVLAAGDSPHLLATNDLEDSPCLATPAIVRSDLLVRTRRYLYCFSSRSDAPSNPSP
jgi:outer membrane protein assembly factor BamB